INTAVGYLTGDSQNSGALGVGQYKASGIDIDQNAFKSGNTQNLAAALKAREGMRAPTMSAAQIDPRQQAQWRADQRSLAQELLEQSRGGGPSLATEQLKMSTDRGIKQAMAMASS